MPVLSRRAFVGGSIAAMGLAGSGAGALAAGYETYGDLPWWVHRLDVLATLLRNGGIDREYWQGSMEDELHAVAFDSFAADIGFDRLRQDATFAARGPARIPIDFDGLDRALNVAFELVALDTGRGIAPHFHSNRVWAQVTLAGAFHVRRFTTLEQDAETVLLDRHMDIVLGDYTILSYGAGHGNVAWQVATDPTFLLEMSVTLPGDEISYVDIEAATEVEDERLRAPLIDDATALAKYG